MKIYAPYVLSRFGKVSFQHYRRQPSTSARHFRQFRPLAGNQIQFITSIRPLAIDRATHQEGPVRGCHPRDGKGVPVGNGQSQMPSPLVIVVPRDERGEEGRISSRRVPQHRRRIAPPCPVRAERENQHPPSASATACTSDHRPSSPNGNSSTTIHASARTSYLSIEDVVLRSSTYPPRTYINVPSIVATTACSRRGMSNGARVSHPASHSRIIDGGPAPPPLPHPGVAPRISDDQSLDAVAGHRTVLPPPHGVYARGRRPNIVDVVRPTNDGGARRGPERVPWRRQSAFHRAPSPPVVIVDGAYPYIGLVLRG